MSLINGIPELDGTNYEKWYQKLEIALAMGNIDLAITTPAPIELENPVMGENEEATAWALREKNYDTAWTRFDIERAQWRASNSECLMIIKGSIADAIRMSITDCPTASEYLAKVKS